MSQHPRYFRVLLTFLRNSLVRDMTFRANFLIDTISSTSWVFMNLGFYILIFEQTERIGTSADWDPGWQKEQFFLFLATTLLINSLIRGLFLSNAVEFSEQIRTGTLDFALVKPIDTQFLISLGRIEWSSIGPFTCGLLLMAYSLHQIHLGSGYVPGAVEVLLYVFYLGCGVAIYYSLMIAMASTSIWLGRNRTLLDFWFYITNFSRYPMEIYQRGLGFALLYFFTYFVPVLVAVNVPARLLVRPLSPQHTEDWILPPFAVLATLGSLAASRWVFNRSLLSYRSASS
ncbi:MAG: ABC-2 family transporter protein [Gemmatimonadota bacterium]|nr:MAG: ABC-2 family transporter protein [Gemmatimonadota bacterium]